MSVTAVGLITTKSAPRIESSLPLHCAVVLLLLFGGCSLSANKRGLGSGEELPGERYQELSEPLGMSSRLYLDSQ